MKKYGATPDSRDVARGAPPAPATKFRFLATLRSKVSDLIDFLQMEGLSNVRLWERGPLPACQVFSLRQSVRKTVVISNFVNLRNDRLVLLEGGGVPVSPPNLNFLCHRPFESR